MTLCRMIHLMERGFAAAVAPFRKWQLVGIVCVLRTDIFCGEGGELKNFMGELKIFINFINFYKFW